MTLVVRQSPFKHIFNLTSTLIDKIDRICTEFPEIPISSKRFGLNYMGCHGGVKAVQLAAALANEHVGNRVLVVCVELCSLHTVSCCVYGLFEACLSVSTFFIES
jgi:predicted naringenin-chalcone synthase